MRWGGKWGLPRRRRRPPRTGTFEHGKLADLVVLDHDLDHLETTPIGDVGVLLTLVEGESVYESPE